jgi:aryl-alcohol dehydrogenase-like predicted oxidoreductase
MKYGRVAGVAKPVSRLVQGTVMISSAKLEQSLTLLDGVYELGCRAFDTAHVYGRGDNERTVGRWVNERGVRDEVVIIGKGAHHSSERKRVTPADITEDLMASLKAFGFDAVDLYLLHRDDPTVPVGEIVDVLNEHQRAGRIGAFGGSNWSTTRLSEANEYARAHGLTPFAASSPNLSLAEQVAEPWPGCVSIGGPGGEAARAWYHETGMPVFAWSSLAGGFFSGRFRRDNLDEFEAPLDRLCVTSYATEANFERLDRAAALGREKGLTAAQIALAYVFGLPLDVYALVGCQTPAEFALNREALDVTLTADERAWLDLRSDGK